LRQFGDVDGAVGLSTGGGERGVADAEEVEAGEGDHVDGEFAKVWVELPRELRWGRGQAVGVVGSGNSREGDEGSRGREKGKKKKKKNAKSVIFLLISPWKSLQNHSKQHPKPTYPQTSRHARHHNADEVVEVGVSRNTKLESPGANVVCERWALSNVPEWSHERGDVQSASLSCSRSQKRGNQRWFLEEKEKNTTYDTERLIGVLNQLMNRQRRIVRLNDRIGHLGRRDDRESRHHAVGELFTDLGDEEGAHAGAGTATEGVGDLGARGRWWM
jgi:hypothetical protein